MAERTSAPGRAAYGDPRRLRRVFTWFGAAVLACLVAGMAIVLSNGDRLFALIIAVSIPPAALALALARLNRLEASAILLALTMFATLTILATRGLGIHHLSNLGFPVVMIISSMVTRKRTLIVLALVAVGCIAWLVFGELAGAYTPQPLTHSVPGDFFSASMMIVVTGLLARLLSEALFTNSLQLQRELRERENAERALRASEQRYRALFENAGEAMLLTDPEGGVLDANPAASRMLGGSREQICQLKRATLLDESDPRLAEGLRERARTGRFEGELRLRRRDGTLFPAAVTSVLFTGEEGEPRTSMVIRDLTEIRRAEGEQSRLQAQLLHAQKMESVGRLAGGMAHDFNNMLSVILGRSELALEGAGGERQVRDCLQEIHKAAERSAGLTRQLLAFARRQAIVPKVLDMNETLEGMLTMLRRLIGEEITLTWRPGKDLWPVRIDASQVDQVLANLCVNARDAISGIGTIEIVTRNATLDETWCARNPEFSPGDYVAVSVSDNGCGMDKDVLDRLFEPFFTTKKQGVGTGLGLPTVYGIVRQNNGAIDVSSQPGKGSTFTIYVPRHGGEVAHAQEAARTQTVGGGETVLLVEDEPSVLQMGRIMLERLGYRVLPAGTPAEAMRVEEQHRGEIALLMTDVIMPEMNGKELFETLARRRSKLKCLFCSGYTADAIDRQGVLDEGVDFIQKPFSAKDLAVKVRAVLDA